MHTGFGAWRMLSPRVGLDILVKRKFSANPRDGRSLASVKGSSLAGTVGLNPYAGHGCLSLVSVVLYQ
jgi:hypothetical protein